MYLLARRCQQLSRQGHERKAKGSPISGTDYSGRDHITVEDCFWIARLVMKHSFSVSELQTVCSVHVANDHSQVVSVHYVRDSGVVSVEVLDSQLPKHWTLCRQMGDVVILRLTEWAEGLHRAVKFTKMIIETSMSCQNLSGRSKVSLIHPDQISIKSVSLGLIRCETVGLERTDGPARL